MTRTIRNSLLAVAAVRLLLASCAGAADAMGLVLRAGTLLIAVTGLAPILLGTIGRRAGDLP